MEYITYVRVLGLRSKSVLNQAISPVRVQIADRVWFVFALDSAQGPLT